MTSVLSSDWQGKCWPVLLPSILPVPPCKEAASNAAWNIQMGTVRRLTEARLRTILQRQDPPSFGRDYDPSIRAVREEAPRLSRYAKVRSEVVGRYIHALSAPEKWTLFIVLYCPRLFDIHEQRMLPYLPAPHPLAGHPLAAGIKLPDFRGTLAVAQELGALDLHPVLHVPDKGNPGRFNAVPFPWIGDFLLFLQDAQGPYCVNLTIKSTEAEFDVPSVGTTSKTDMGRAIRREEIRHKVEKILYDDIGIPTIRVAADQLSPVLLANLEQIYGWQRRGHPFDEYQRLEIVEALRSGLLAGTSALEIIHNLMVEFGYSIEHVKSVLYQSIWQRELRIDLYQYFFIEKPMIPERRDVLNEFSHCFRRA